MSFHAMLFVLILAEKAQKKNQNTILIFPEGNS